MRPPMNGNGWELVPEEYSPGEVYSPYGPGPSPPPYSGPPRPEEIAPPPPPPPPINGLLPEEPADEQLSPVNAAASAGVGAGVGLMLGGAAVLLWLLASGRRSG